MYREDLAIIKTADERVSLIYSDKASIRINDIENGIWREKFFLQDIRGGLSVNVINSGKCFITNLDGQLVLCHEKDEAWQKTVLMSSVGADKDALFHVLSDKSAMSFIYDIDDGTEKGLMRLNAEEGCFGRPKKIASFLPFRGRPYLTYAVNNKSAYICLKARDGAINVLTADLEKDEILQDTVVKNGDAFEEISLLPSNGRLHALYIVRGRISSQLIYKSKAKGSFGQAKILWEGKRAGECLLFEGDKTLYALISSGDKIYYSASYNNGFSFEPFNRLNVNPQGTVFKAMVINRSGNPYYCACETFLDEKNSLLVFNALCPEFVQGMETVTAAADSHGEDSGGKLLNRIRQLEKEIIENNSQISGLSQMLREKNGETMKAVGRFNEKILALTKKLDATEGELEKLGEKNERMAEKIIALENENETLHIQLKGLKSENTALKKAKAVLEEEIFRLNTPKDAENG